MRRGVVTAGALTVDRVKRIDAWPLQDGLAVIEGEGDEGGASSFNMAVDLRRLDAPFPVATTGLLGDDADGRFVAAALRAEGVDVAGLRTTDAAPTSYTDVMTDTVTGRRTFFHRPGCNAIATPDDYDVSGSPARWLHLGMPGVHRTLDAPWQGDANGWVTVLRKARAAGLRTNVELVSLAPARIAAVARPFLAHLDALVVNDAEIGAVAGIDTVRDGVADPAACLRAARAVLEAGSMEIVVVHFPLGAVAATRDGTVATQASVAVPDTAIVGTNGAGDAFAAGMLMGLHEGWPLQRSLVLAHAAAAASLRALTTIGAIEPWPACLALAERWGWRAPVSL
jgi:sugar/nucleoside kinase (ribokinase family)